RTSADDGRCGPSTDAQSQTTFRETVESYDRGVKDLDANVHPYVVFGNSGSKRGWRNFDPEEYGIEPLSIMAVVCGDRLIYGVWGDTNGDDGPHPMVGEASISVATACFGDGITGNSGHDEDDVMYIAFVGEDAVPGARGADWSAKSYESFEKSIEERGDMLVERINGSYDGEYDEGDDSGAGGSLLWVRYLVISLGVSLVATL
ncbi:glycoside hydrolase family 75 protein, partial [Candidatus Bathyarchaeota archaeon]|nr:glycoside hydrolase family 75 protein [Candidatus Bathyarchaeota archaeon]